MSLKDTNLRGSKFIDSKPTETYSKPTETYRIIEEFCTYGCSLT